MKSLIFSLFFVASLFIPLKSFSQTAVADSLQKKESVKTEMSLEEKLNTILLYIADNTQSNNYYKLYPTTNIWTFIKLDTRSGKLWQVQFGLEEKYRHETPINSLDFSFDGEKASRFELYPTQNMYNFLLLDKITGRTWQVQWSMQETNREIYRIY